MTAPSAGRARRPATRQSVLIFDSRTGIGAATDGRRCRDHDDSADGHSGSLAKTYAKHECLFGIEQEYTFSRGCRRGSSGSAASAPGRLLLRRRVGRDLRARDRRGARGSASRPGSCTAASTPRVIGQWEFQQPRRSVAGGRHERCGSPVGSAPPRTSVADARMKGDWNAPWPPTFPTRRPQIRTAATSYRERLQGPRQEVGAASRTTATASRTASPATTRRRREQVQLRRVRPAAPIRIPLRP